MMAGRAHEDPFRAALRSRPEIGRDLPPESRRVSALMEYTHRLMAKSRVG